MIKVKHVIRLIERLAEMTDQSLDHYGFGKMCEKIDDDDITQRYLGDVYRGMKKYEKINREMTATHGYRLDPIAKYVGFKNFRRFSSFCDNPISPIIMSCIGNWWSFVRANSGEHILKAPVRIYFDPAKGAIMFELNGQERKFSGEMEEKGGCISGFLESGTDKKIGLIFKVGNTTKMELLQGVFCGVSSSGSPIAGREILVRESLLKYDDMKWFRLELNDKSIDKRILSFFAEYCANCIKVKDVQGFDLDALN